MKKDKAAWTDAEDNEKGTFKVFAAEVATQNAVELKKVLTMKNL